MNETPPKEDSLREELHNLGKNISALFRAAWESQERQVVQKEIEEGLTEMVAALNKAAVEFRQSKTGQQFEQDIADLSRRIHSGEIESKIRSDIREVLAKINTELENGTARWGSESTPNNPPDPPPDSNN